MSHKHTTTLDPKQRLLPTEYSSDARSRSQSRTRIHRSSHDSDPLLSNLSPTSTLEALSYVDFRPAETRKASSELRESIASASSSERALGIRAASAAKKLKEWHAEVLAWRWPGPTERRNGFEVPSGEEVVTRDTRGQTQNGRLDKEQEYWGSLRRDVVEEYEERIEVIADGMEALDVEELKSHVLEAHIPSRSRSASISHHGGPAPEVLSHSHLDDFTAVITATILQALPYVARLNILLHTWSVRLLILRQVPGFLGALEDASTAITSGWSTLSASGSSTPGHNTGISRDALNVMQPILEERLTAAGQRLDRMLDALEGREDTVPQQWIEDMENLEADYSNWVVEAEKKVLENELRQYRKHPSEPKRQPAVEHELSQTSPSHSKPSPFVEDTIVKQHPKDDREVLSNHVHPSRQNSELSSALEVTDSALDPSTINFTLLDQESSILPSDDGGILQAGREHTVEDRVIVPPSTAKLSQPDQALSPVTGSSQAGSTAKDLFSRLEPSGLETPFSGKEQNLPVTGDKLGSHRPDRVELTAVRQQWSHKSDNNNHAIQTSHQANHIESMAQKDHHETKSPHAIDEVQPRIPTSGSLPLESFDPSSEALERNTMQTDGALEDHGTQRSKDESTNWMSDTSNDHDAGKASAYQNNTTSSPMPTMVAEHTESNDPSLLSEKAVTATSREDSPKSSPRDLTQTDNDTLADSAMSLPMPGSWDEEGVDIEAAHDPGKTSPPIDIIEPRIESTSSTHDKPGEDGHEHAVEITDTENGLRRPTGLTLRSHIPHVHQSTSSDNSQPGSATSDFYSTASSPEIRDARAAQSFGKPVEVTSPIRLSQDRNSRQLGLDTPSSSRQTGRTSHDLPRQGDLYTPTTPVLQRNRGSSFALEPTIHEDAIGRHNEDLSHEGGDRDTDLRRASVASIELLSRNEVSKTFNLVLIEISFGTTAKYNQVKSINVRRRSGSYSSTQPTPSGPSSETSGLRTPTSSVRQIHYTNASEDDSQSGGSPSPLAGISDEEPSPLIQKSNLRNAELVGHKTTPTSLSVPKRSTRLASSLNPSSDSRVRPWRRGASEPLSDDSNRFNKPGQMPSLNKSTEEQLEEKISSILTTIPARIRLTSGPDANAPEVVRPRSLSGTKRPDILSQAMRSSRQSSEGPSLTLAPAYAKSSPSSASPGDPEIRVYHLHQAGRDMPIKLYIRLVGEYGERVMVRVGGGWADLGEYLKEYANHHGRRSVSDGKFEIKGLPQAQSTSSITTLAGLSTTPTSRPGSALGRPASALSVRKSRFAGGSSADSATPSTPDQHFTALHDVTPGSTESHSTSVRPSSRSSWTGEDAPLGLAGPKSRRIEVSPDKQAWVDGMMEQAKRASAERRKPEEAFFGDLGKVGGTKRVFMRSSKEV